MCHSVLCLPSFYLTSAFICLPIHSNLQNRPHALIFNNFAFFWHQKRSTQWFTRTRPGMRMRLTWREAWLSRWFRGTWRAGGRSGNKVKDITFGKVNIINIKLWQVNVFKNTAWLQILDNEVRKYWMISLNRLPVSVPSQVFVFSPEATDCTSLLLSGIRVVRAGPQPPTWRRLTSRN